MRRPAIALIACAMFVAACGGNDSTTDASETTAGTTATTAAAATTATTAATTTTAMATMSGPEAYIAASAENLGEYNGQWDNATFSSSGDLYINVMEANTEAGFVLIQVDADGNAFGAADPPLFLVEISVDGDGLYVGFSEFLGRSTFEIDDAGNFTMVAEPPLLGGMTLEVEGTITADGFGGTYVIPNLAEGTWSASR